jgi:hypothetical protein
MTIGNPKNRARSAEPPDTGMRHGVGTIDINAMNKITPNCKVKKTTVPGDTRTEPVTLVPC